MTDPLVSETGTLVSLPVTLTDGRDIAGGAVVLKFSYAQDSSFYYIQDGPVLPADELVAEEVFRAIFDALEEWFGQPDYEGCLFINALLETRDHESPVRKAAIVAIEHVYEVVQRLLEEAGVADSQAVAHQIQIIMRGSIVAAVEGRGVGPDTRPSRRAWLRHYRGRA